MSTYIGVFVKTYCEGIKDIQTGCNNPKCEEFGNNIRIDWDFCPKCGTKIAELINPTWFSFRSKESVSANKVTRLMNSYLYTIDGKGVGDKFENIWVPVHQHDQKHNDIVVSKRRQNLGDTVMFEYVSKEEIEDEQFNFEKAYHKELNILREHYEKVTIHWGAVNVSMGYWP
jgi:hypothetical protein